MNPIYISPTNGDVFIPMGGTPLSEGADALALVTVGYRPGCRMAQVRRHSGICGFDIAFD